MTKRFQAILFLLMTMCLQLYADTYDGIYVWVKGSSTCYKLESVPHVTFGNNKATLTVDGNEILTLPITDSNNLIITYGIYEPTIISYTISSAAYGTLILPFDSALPNGMQAYSIFSKVEGKNTLVLSEVTELKANTPYVVYSTGTPAQSDDSPILVRNKIGFVKNYTFTFSGMPINSKTEYTDGLLVGELSSHIAPNYAENSDSVAYVLQMQNNQVGFYRVQSDNITVGANHCYLRLSKEQAANVRALYFDTDGETTGISELTTNYNNKVYKEGKYIRGGHVIVIKNGKQYNINGTLIK